MRIAFNFGTETMAARFAERSEDELYVFPVTMSYNER